MLIDISEGDSVDEDIVAAKAKVGVLTSSIFASGPGQSPKVWRF